MTKLTLQGASPPGGGGLRPKSVPPTSDEHVKHKAHNQAPIILIISTTTTTNKFGACLVLELFLDRSWMLPCFCFMTPFLFVYLTSNELITKVFTLSLMAQSIITTNYCHTLILIPVPVIPPPVIMETPCKTSLGRGKGGARGQRATAKSRV